MGHIRALSPVNVTNKALNPKRRIYIPDTRYGFGFMGRLKGCLQNAALFGRQGRELRIARRAKLRRAVGAEREKKNVPDPNERRR